MQIKELHITNYQSHKNSVLKFHPNTNVIKGISDSGKSSIERTLRLLFENKPSSDKNYRSWWGGITHIKLITREGHVIEREKGDSGHNIYRLDGEDFTGFKSEVPNEIKKLLNISPVNIQRASHSPYMLSDSSGEAAKKLNSAVNISKINDVLSNLSSRHRRIKERISDTQSAIDSDFEKQRSLSFINIANSEFELIEKLEEIIHSSDNSLIELFDLQKNIRRLDTRISDIIFEDYSKSNLDAIFKEYQDREDELGFLEELLNTADILPKFTHSFEEIEEAFIPIVEMKQSYDDLSTDVSYMASLMDDIQQHNKWIAISDKEYKEATEIYEEEFPKICPLCKQPMP